MQLLPLTPGVPAYRVATVLGDLGYVFDVRWNHRDRCWYLDAYEDDGVTAIFHGVKIVLGANLGRIHRQPLVTNGVLVAFDTSRQHLDADLADLGSRVLVAYLPALEVAALAQRSGLEAL
jgi:hypothetical protein